MSALHVVLIVLLVVAGLTLVAGLIWWAFIDFRDGGSWR